MINKLFPLVKEIVSKTGVVHFRRWAILEKPRLRIYLHQILEKDQDAHEHDHPWNFCSIILKGGYTESSMGKMTRTTPGKILFKSHCIPHKIAELHSPTWTLVIAWGERKEWGYSTNSGWIDNISYRKMKNEGSLKA